MPRFYRALFGGLVAGLFGLSGAASAAPSGLPAGKLATEAPAKLIGQHGGGMGGGGHSSHSFGGSGGSSRNWDHGGHHDHHRDHRRGFVGFYGGYYPYADNYFSDDYGYRNDEVCSYSLRHRATLCPGD